MRNQIDKLVDFPIFAGISKADLPAMLECMGAKSKRFKRGEIIFLTDDKIKYIGVVLSGRVHMIRENSSGDQTLLSIMREGDVFGESFVCGERKQAYTTFVVVEQAMILGLPFQKVINTCTNRCAFHQVLIENMLMILANKNVRLMEKIDVSSQKTLREKILSYLRLEAERQGTLRVELPMNRTVLADYLGVNRSALARELTQMKEEGILDFEKNTFYLNDD